MELIAAVEECESENVGQAFVSPQHSHDYPEIFTPPKQPPALSHHKSPPRQYSYSARTHQTLFTDHSQKVGFQVIVLLGAPNIKIFARSPLHYVSSHWKAFGTFLFMNDLILETNLISNNAKYLCSIR